MSDFAHLHVHTQYSLLDSPIRVDELCEAAAADGQTAIAMTDHGNLFGALDFYTAAKENSLKPILGCEMYLAPDSRLRKATHGSGDDELAPYATARSGMSHIVLLCQNEVGYLNLCKLVSSGYLEGFYYKPRIDKEILARHSEGLFALSSCLKGEIPAALLLGDMNRARTAATYYKDTFGDRFHLELIASGLPQQMIVNERLIDLGKEMGIPIVGTADVHYLKPQDAHLHEVLMAAATGRTIERRSDELPSDQYYLKSRETMKSDFAHCPEAIENTMRIADRCQFDFRFNDDQGKKIYHFPKFEPPGGKTPVEFLNESTAEGLRKRFAHSIAMGRAAFTPAEIEKYDKRLDRELQVINNMGFTGYFLIVADFIQHARTHDIPVGPGRGSGAGSLVAYALGITELDPLEHGLLFERFLNPERISLPDFDVDFCMDKRGQIIEYVVQKYGADCVAQIITFGKLQARGVIRDVGRVFGILPIDVGKIATLVPETVNITLAEAFAQEPRLRQVVEKDARLAELFDVCRKLEGLLRHASIHAAGLVISNRPMVEHCPLYRGKNDELVIQFDMNNADKIGLIKFDFLGLKTLTFLRTAEKLIQAAHPEANFALERIPFYDKPTLQMLAKGDTAGVFQLESSGMQDLMKKIRPDAFADIVASNALYRPGPLESGMVDDYIARKHGQTPVIFDFEELRPILQETYGVIVYQEQVQQVAMRLAGYTAGSADLLRRAMGKKKPEEMAKQKAIFLDGGAKNGFDKTKLEKTFDLMEKFAGYGFNKSHAAAYSLITVQTAYIKAHYQVEFYAALLSIERENTDKITKYIADARRKGIEVLQPDINESSTDFTVIDKKRIRFGLGAIKGVGQIAIDEIVASRLKDGPFRDLFDLCSRCSSRLVNKRVLEAFVKAGTFDSFGVHRASQFQAIDEALLQGSSAQKSRDELQDSFASLLGIEEDAFAGRKVEYPKAEHWKRSVELRYEKDTTGFFLTGHPLDEHRLDLDRYTTTTIGALGHFGSSKDVMVGAEVVAIREIFTRKGDRMAFVTLGDQTGEIEAVVFSDLFVEKEDVWKSQEPLWIKAQLEVADGSAKLLLSKKGKADVLPLRYAYEVMAREIHVKMPVPKDVRAPEVTRKFEALRDLVKARQAPTGGFVFLHLRVPAGSTATLRLREPIPITRDNVAAIRNLFPGDGPTVDFR